MASYKSRTYACPFCENTFSFLHTVTKGVEDSPPDYCVRCGAYVGPEQEPIPMFGTIGKAKNKSPDSVYRALESSSAARAQEAADMAGVPLSDMSHLKTTDMKDNLREGDTSAKVSAPSVPTYTPPPPSNISPINSQAGLATANMIRQSGGSVGQTVMDGLRKNHIQRSKSMERAGQMGAFAGNGK